MSADGSEITTVAGTHAMGNGPDVATPATQVALTDPNGLHVLGDGTFYIFDTGNSKIRRVSPSGECSTIHTFTPTPSFLVGRGLWVSDDEQPIYFCGEIIFSGPQTGLQAVMKFSAADGVVSNYAHLPPGERGLGNLDVAPDGSLGVTSSGDHRVYRITGPGATPVIIAGNGMEGNNSTSGVPATSVPLERVRGISFLPDGSYFLATQKGGDIWWVDLDGNIQLFVSGSGSGNVKSGDGLVHNSAGDKISEPRATHWASNGDLLIVSNDTGVVRAVNTTSTRSAPQATLTEGLQNFTLSFPATTKGRYLLESSTSLISDDWTAETGLSSSENKIFSHPLLKNGGTKFWRIVVPSEAGGN
ncbi:hypothetical protein N9268_00165 [Akkermansiaceae bacterium]|nr:hypothetical protein [Akkermansiaceae bacterium]MDB4421370.1 hypothetical protein [Akkermansiaceae bacterium]MDB4458043.1 hypothetical protein [Akkermansiaceae bacterium]MDB4462473.1 hypothetical protein [Akkermansiaceae bacterium]MDB4545883.1 hypothetical protein [Akkermansiaceae bacterium]